MFVIVEFIPPLSSYKNIKRSIIAEVPFTQATVKYYCKSTFYDL